MSLENPFTQSIYLSMQLNNKHISKKKIQQKVTKIETDL